MRKKDGSPLLLSCTEWEYTNLNEKATLTFGVSTFHLTIKTGTDMQIIEEKGCCSYIDSSVTLIPDGDKEDSLAGTVTGDTITFDDDGKTSIFHRK